MRVQLQRVLCSDEGQEETVTDVITLNKNHQRLEQLGLTLAEAKQLLSTLQRHNHQDLSALARRHPLPDHQVRLGAGLRSLINSLGSTFGIAVAGIMLEQRLAVRLALLGEGQPLGAFGGYHTMFPYM